MEGSVGFRNDLKRIEPGMTRPRVGVFEIPNALLKSSFIIRIKGHDIKVRISRQKVRVPLGVYFSGSVVNGL